MWLYKKFVSTSRTTVFIDMRNHVKFFFGHVFSKRRNIHFIFLELRSRKVTKVYMSALLVRTIVIF